MAYPVPSLYAPKVNLNAPGTSVNYWADVDANAVSSSIVSVVGYVNTLSASLGSGSGSINDLSASLTALSGAFVYSVGSWASMSIGGNITTALAQLSGDFYGSDIVSNAYVSQTVYSASLALFNNGDLAAASPTGAFPLSSYSNMWAAFWTMSGNINTSASAWNSVSSSYSSLSGNLDSSASIWNATSQSYYTLSGNLDSSASIWNATSQSYYVLSGNLDSSASIWNTVSSAFNTLSGNLNFSASNWNSAAFVTSSNWAPVGGIFSVTGSLQTSQGIVASGSIEASASFILMSPNGTRWSITIDNSGILSSTALP